MKEILINGFVKIQPLQYKGFVAGDKVTYEQVGTVLACYEGCTIPIGAKVWFDSFMAKKYPVPGKENEYEYFVNKDEVVKYEVNE